MARLNIDRQRRLEPIRADKAEQELSAKGFICEREIGAAGGITIKFIYKGALVRFYPYSGWAAGKTIQDGRGLDKLLKQLKK